VQSVVGVWKHSESLAQLSWQAGAQPQYDRQTVLATEAERAAAALLRALDGAAAALGAVTGGAGGSPRLPAGLSGALQALDADLGRRRAAAAALHAALAGDGGAGGGASAAGRVEWVDGALTRAVEEGRWVLLDNAGACPATVRACCSSAPSTSLQVMTMRTKPAVKIVLSRPGPLTSGTLCGFGGMPVRAPLRGSAGSCQAAPCTGHDGRAKPAAQALRPAGSRSYIYLRIGLRLMTSPCPAWRPCPKPRRARRCWTG